MRSTPRTGLNRVNCTNANTYRVGTSPLIPPYKSGFQRAAWEPFGVSFSDIFLHAKKDVAAGGRSFRRAFRDIEKHQYCATGGRQSTTAPRKNEQKLNSKRPAAVPRVGLFPFSCSHHTTFPFHCLPLFFHFAEIFKKIALKPSPHRLNSVQRRRKPLQRPVPPPVDHGFFQFQLLAEPIQISPPRLHVHPPQHQPLRLAQGR